ncbi:MAG: DUF983 domain-containing protein, partial [Aestuariivirgaceae bacterium]
MSDHRHYPPQPAVSVGLAGRCPRCGQGRLFSGVTKIAPRCRACGLDFVDPGDGAAMFVILIGNIVILGAALWVEFTFEPPFWVHIILWPPLSLGFCVLALRLIKGLLVAQQY